MPCCSRAKAEILLHAYLNTHQLRESYTVFPSAEDVALRASIRKIKTTDKIGWICIFHLKLGDVAAYWRLICIGCQRSYFSSPQGDIGACLTKYDAADKCFHVRKIYASHHLVKLSEGKLQHILSQVIRWSKSLKVPKLDGSAVPCIHMNSSKAASLKQVIALNFVSDQVINSWLSFLSFGVSLRLHSAVNAALASLIVSNFPGQTPNHWRSKHLILVH